MDFIVTFSNIIRILDKKTRTMMNLTPHEVMVINMICEHYGETLECLSDKSRIQKKVFARQLSMLYLRKQYYTLTDIGRFLDKDHSTVIHGIRSAEQLVASVEDTRSFWNRINVNFAA